MKEPATPRELWAWWTPFSLGGVENFLLSYAQQHLEHRGAFAVAAVQSAEGSLKERYPPTTRRLDWSGFQRAYLGDPTEMPGLPARIAGDIATLQPSLVSVNGCADFGTGAWPLLHALRGHATVIDVLHADVPAQRYYEERKPYLTLLDGVVSSSRSALDRLSAISRRAREIPRIYIPYGVEVPDRERTPPGKRLRILVAGRLAREQKRVHLLPAIFARLAALGRDFEATIAGDGPERGALENDLAAAGLGGRVHLAGHLTRDEVIAACFEHDVIVNCSDYEGFPISVIEALAAGCVPVCTDLPSRDREILREGETCRVVPIEEAVRIADVCSALESEELRRMSDAAKSAGRALTQERMWEAYQRFFAELRRDRPLAAWTSPPRLPRRWNPASHNPWIPRRFGSLRNLVTGRSGLWR